MKNKANRVDLKAMTEKAEEVFSELHNWPNGMHRLVKGLKTDSKIKRNLFFLQWW